MRKRNLEKIIEEALELFRSMLMDNWDDVARLEEGFEQWMQNVLLGQALPYGRFSSTAIARRSDEFRSTLRGMYSDPEWEDGVVIEDICATLAAVTTFDAQRETAEEDERWEYERRETENWLRRQY